jgi:Zn-dependent metalloprotease
LIVNTNGNGDLYSMNGEVSPNLALPTKPTIDSAQAKVNALEAIAKWYELSPNDFVATEPELWIFDESLLMPSNRPVELVWRVEVSSVDNSMPVRELVLVNAQRGNISTHFNQIDTAWSFDIDSGNSLSTELSQATITPTPPIPTETPTPPSEDLPTEDDVIPTPTPQSEKPDSSNEEQKSPPVPQAGVSYYVNIATGNNSNSCTSPASPCKNIQETINKAGTNDTLYVSSGTYFFSSNGSPNVVVINGKNLNIIGGWDSTFTTQNGVSTIDGGNANNGVLLVSGTVTIEGFIIQNSRSSNSGAIYMVNGNLTVKRSTLKNNIATNDGAGIFIDNGTLTVINSTISGNTATASGGGIYASNNIGSSVTVQNSTIAYNTAATGGGINRTNGSFQITNTIIANNTGTTSAPDCNGTLTSASYSIIENTANCSITTASNNLNVDPQISATLSGIYQVHTLDNGSPAINAGTNTNCPTNDQVNTTRPLGSSCDIGAIEQEQGTKHLNVISGNNQSAVINSAFSLPLKVLVLDENNLPVSGVDVTFSAPVSGASGLFTTSGTKTEIVQSDLNGYATSSSFTANGNLGSYVITASASDYSSTIFALSNTEETCPRVNTSGSGDIYFRPYVRYDCDLYGYGVGAGDFNNDGKIDAALSVRSGPGFQSALLIFLQDNNGNFFQPVSYLAGLRTDYLAVGDVNNDGRDDVVTVDNFDGKIGVYLQNSSGTLNNRVTYVTGTNPDSIAIGDLNDDGLDDVVVSHWNSATIGVFIQNNSGALNTMTTYPTVAAGYGDIAIGDINNDGLNDVVKMNGQGNSASTLVVHTQDTSHTLTSYTLYTCSTACIGNGLEVGDVTGDNKADIVMSYGGNGGSAKIAVFVQNESGELEPSTSYSSYDIPDPVEIADMNSDGLLDVIVLHTGWSKAGIYPQKLDGTLGTEKLYSIPYSSYSSQSVSIGDVNNDGLSDILIADGQGLVILYRKSPTPDTFIIESGSNQEVPLETQFPQPLKVKAVNYLLQPLSGISITFTSPSSGASGTFNDTNTNTTTAITDINGIATSSAFTSNNVYGSYVVTATSASLTGSVNFQLSNSIQDIETYTANNTTALPGTFLCDEDTLNCTNGVNSHADKAHLYSIGTYNIYVDTHDRQSIDNNNFPIISSVHYGNGYANAFWSGSQMVYGNGYGFALADDVVAHELTHGVTQYESNLFYYYQSGAINESFSDLWGEYYDQSNGLGTDTAGVKWLLGEDVSGLGALRDMRNPPAYGDPDKMTSTYYYKDSGDNGGVHTNSGVNNKAVYLMVDGGSFNGRTVTSLGWEKTAKIYYEAQTNLLSSGADYSDLYYALQQACTNLVGQYGILAGDCVEVKDALDAVEMNLQPATNFNPDAPLCTSPSQPFAIDVYTEDFESGLGSWSITNGTYPRWQYDSPYGPFAHSGDHFLYGDDYPQVGGNPTDARAQWSAKVIPAGAYLHFSHAYDFEYSGGYNWDGGVIEYSTNGGTSWMDAGSLIVNNGYKGVIYPNYINPLKGRNAFVQTSHGYISTRLNLSSLAGQSVSFRWRMGLDDDVVAWGWWVDDVRIYTCSAGPAISGNAGASGVVLSYTDGTAKTVTSQDNGDYLLPVSNNWSGTVTPTHACYTFDPVSRSYSNITTNQSAQNYTATLNPSSGCSEVDVTIGTALMGTYPMDSGESLVETYLGVNGGPVVIKSNNGAKIIASYLQYRRPGTTGGWTGITQTMALTDEQISDTYVIPHYDYTDSTKYQHFQIANFDTIATNVTVTIGGVLKGTYPLDVGSAVNVLYPNFAGGPAVISSDNGAKLVVSLYELKRAGTSGFWTGQTQMMGLPLSQLSDTYVFPRYNYTLQDLLPFVVFANADNVPTTITVTIGGILRGTYPMASGQSMVQSYNGVNGGPVVIKSNNGAKIIASYLQYRRPGTTGGWTGITQTMALTDEQISDTYVIPHYDYTDSTKYQHFQIANFDTIATNVTVTIGGVLKGTYPLDVGSAVNVLYPNFAGGPAVISSDNGAKLVVSLYELKRAGTSGFWTGQTQMMGLPLSQLSDTYVFPRYNYTLQDLLPFVVFAVP